MGDALSDARKDDTRERIFNSYTRLLEEYKLSPSEERRVELVKAAKAVDECTGGWTPRTEIVEFLQREYGEGFVKIDPSLTTC